MIQSSDDDKARMIKNGGSNTEETSVMVRNMLGSIERKVDEEAGARQRDMGENKDQLA